MEEPRSNKPEQTRINIDGVDVDVPTAEYQSDPEGVTEKAKAILTEHGVL